MTNNKKHALWTEKYRPQTVDQYIFHDTHLKAAVYRMIADKSIPHLLLSGTAGSGKTTLAQILIRALEIDDTDVLTINASDEKGIDIFREKIKTLRLAGKSNIEIAEKVKKSVIRVSQIVSELIRAGELEARVNRFA